MSLKIVLPPGRIVMGSPTYKQENDMHGRKKEKPNWFMAVAVPKNTIGDILNQIMQLAWSGYAQYPQIQQRIQQGLAGQFAWKIEDGDDQKNRGKEGWAGCWIFKFNTILGVMKSVDQNNVPIDPAFIKCGYWVDVAASISINEQTDHTAGIYVNPDCVRFCGYAPEIVPGPSPDQLFAGRPAALPPGASATPVAPAGNPGGNPFAGGAAPTSAPGAFGGHTPAPHAGGGFPGASAPQQPSGGFQQPAQGFQQPQPGFAAAPGQGAPGSPGQPAGGFPAGATPAPGFQGTASPSNPQQQAQAAWPAVQPQTGWPAQ